MNMNMKLGVYRTRGGDIATVTKNTGGLIFPWSGRVKQVNAVNTRDWAETWDEYGYTLGPVTTTPRDLVEFLSIEEYPEFYI